MTASDSELKSLDEYDFTVDWFTRFAGIWRQLIDRHQPRRFLEIGSYEGRSACFVIDHLAASQEIELHCVDTWAGGVGHGDTVMSEVEKRFDRNVAIAKARAGNAVALHKHKAHSADALVRLLADGNKEAFDFIYIDGSHQAPDVLADCVLAFRLLKVGGIMINDDYLWSTDQQGQQDFYNLPKPAVDAFMNIYQRKMAVLGAPLYQLYARKTAQ